MSYIGVHPPHPDNASLHHTPDPPCNTSCRDNSGNPACGYMTHNLKKSEYLFKWLSNYILIFIFYTLRKYINKKWI